MERGLMLFNEALKHSNLDFTLWQAQMSHKDVVTVVIVHLSQI